MTLLRVRVCIPRARSFTGFSQAAAAAGERQREEQTEDFKIPCCTEGPLKGIINELKKKEKNPLVLARFLLAAKQQAKLLISTVSFDTHNILLRQALIRSLFHR